TNFALDPSEIARQNQITQQLLSTYLQTRLGLGVGVTQKVPTIAEILPKAILTTTTSTTTTTTTAKPRYSKSLKRPRPRGFSVSSSSKRGGGSTKTNYQRKTYGSTSQRKTPNSLQELLKYRGYSRLQAQKQKEQQQQPEDDYDEDDVESESEEEEEEDSQADAENDYGDGEPEDEPAADEEDNTNNKTLNYKRPSRQRYDPYDDRDDYDEYRSQYTRPRYRSQQLQQQRYRYPHHRHYDDDIDQDGQEALQSVESEQHDLFARDPSENEIDSDCPHCVDDTQYMNKWTMPLLKLGEKRYYLGIFFKANWFKATQYCRYHGMHLASISSQEENDRLEKHIKDFGLGNEHFWISGTDLADEGNFFWMSTGRPITFTNWNAGEPNNFRYENGEEENCMELWNRDGKGLKWNDSPCSFETYFVCEVQP
ncbi:ubiquitin carboxyl-terminal hydrolase 36-like, partial [Musca vetustissima]|uniref:ubiquitin carboxyl-terminal hydrolase 36-like n=1 Tax=Musca vetustissima TaxID=27455 RepID=UPI002AB655A1